MYLQAWWFLPPASQLPSLRDASTTQHRGVRYHINTSQHSTAHITTHHSTAQHSRRGAFHPLAIKLTQPHGAACNSKRGYRCSLLQHYGRRPSGSVVCCYNQQPPPGLGVCCYNQQPPPGLGVCCYNQQPPSGLGVCCYNQQPTPGFGVLGACYTHI